MASVERGFRGRSGLLGDQAEEPISIRKAALIWVVSALAGWLIAVAVVWLVTQAL